MGGVGLYLPFHYIYQLYVKLGFEMLNREEDKSQEETCRIIFVLFEGFLTIGTLDAEIVTNVERTPWSSLLCNAILKLFRWV